ncbi:MAG: hypothetical protein ACTSW4_04325, partial [Candidatus Ranarchaeia archaeon]
MQVSTGIVTSRSNLIVTQISIISCSGFLLFHRSFIDERIDSSLFSGFTAAILSFSKEIGSKLLAIKLDKFTLYIRNTKSLIIVVGVSDDPEAEIFADSLISQLENSPQFRQVEEIWENKMNHQRRVLNKAVAQILAGLSLEAVTAATPKTVRLQLQLADYIHSFRTGSITPEKVADDMVQKALKMDDPEAVREAASLIGQMLAGEIADKKLIYSLKKLRKLLL